MDGWMDDMDGWTKWMMDGWIGMYIIWMDDMDGWTKWMMDGWIGMYIIWMDDLMVF